MRRLRELIRLEEGRAHVHTLNLPVINVGFPKVGSTSLHLLAECIGWKSVHWRFDNPYYAMNSSEEKFKYAGREMQMCARDGKPMLSCVSGYDVYAQIDVVASESGGCAFPQISNLQGLILENPMATFVLPSRNAEAWAISAIKFRRLDARIAACCLPELDLPCNISGVPSSAASALTDRSWIKRLARAFVHEHNRARAFLRRAELALGVRWFEFELESLSAAETVTTNLGISTRTRKKPTECWGHANRAREGKESSLGEIFRR